MLFSLCANAGSLPLYYNSSESDFKEKLPMVRSQRVEGVRYLDCWSYASTAALEFSCVFNDYWDFSNNKNLFSEYHMAACMNKTKDEKYLYLTRDKESGGNREMAAAYFSRGIASGPVLVTDFNADSYNQYLKEKNNYSLLLDKEKQLSVTKARFLTKAYEGSSILTDGFKYSKNEPVINKIKEAILKHGAVAASYYAYERKEDSIYYNPQTFAYCVLWKDMLEKTTADGNCVVFDNEEYAFKDASNHAITIVGWDDNFSYENFKLPPVSYNGESYTPENGAWIVRNSWGEDFGNNGYEYISYMDPFIGFMSTAYESEILAKSTILTHTPRGIMASVKFSDCPYGEYTLTRYTEENGIMNYVGLYICDETLSAKVLLDTNTADAPKKFTNEEFDQKAAVLIDVETGQELTEIKVDNPGYYVFRLKNPVLVQDAVDVYVRYNVPHLQNIKLATGAEYGTEDYTKNVCYYAGMNEKDSGKWKVFKGNWCVNAYVTKEAFEVPKVTLTKTKAKANFIRYDKSAGAKAYVAVFDNYRMLDCVSEFMLEDNLNLEIKIPENATMVRAFILHSENVTPNGYWRRLKLERYRKYDINKKTAFSRCFFV